MTKMRALRIGFSAALAILGLALIGGAVPPVQAGHILCGAILGRGVHTLDTNVGPCDGPPFFAVGMGSRATLDFNGFTVSCSDTNTDGVVPDGIVVNGNRAQILDTAPTVTSGVIGCNNGIVIRGDRNTVSSVTSSFNILNGFDIGGNRNRLEDSFALSNTANGFLIDGDQNVLDLNRGEDNVLDGFLINTGIRNNLTNNSANANLANGYDIEVAADRTRLTNNLADSNNGTASRSGAIATTCRETPPKTTPTTASTSKATRTS